jgi:hypothetical protein
VGLAFFDRNISVDEKRDMITKMKDTPGSKVPNPRLNKNYDAVGKPLSSFVTRSTRALFTILDLNEAFLLNPRVMERRSRLSRCGTNRFGAKGSERYSGESSQDDAGLQLNPHKRQRPEAVSVTSCSAAS